MMIILSFMLALPIDARAGEPKVVIDHRSIGISGVGELSGGDSFRFPSGFTLKRLAGSDSVMNKIVISKASNQACAFVMGDAKGEEFRLVDALEWKVASFPKFKIGNDNTPDLFEFRLIREDTHRSISVACHSEVTLAQLSSLGFGAPANHDREVRVEQMRDSGEDRDSQSETSLAI